MFLVFQQSVNFSDPMFDLNDRALCSRPGVKTFLNVFGQNVCSNKLNRYFCTDFHFLSSTLSFQKILYQCHLLWKHCSMHHTVYSMYIPPHTVLYINPTIEMDYLKKSILNDLKINHNYYQNVTQTFRYSCIYVKISKYSRI